MVSSETWLTSVTGSGRRNVVQHTLNLRPQDQKAIFLTKSGRELEQDPCQSKASKEGQLFQKWLQNSPWHNVGKQLFGRRMRRLENRKVVLTTTIARQSLSVPTVAMETQPSSFQVSKRGDPPVPVSAVAVVPTPAIVPTEAVAATAPVI